MDSKEAEKKSERMVLVVLVALIVGSFVSKITGDTLGIGVAAVIAGAIYEWHIVKD